MQLTEVLESVQYVTDHQGQKKAVLLDLDAWQTLVELLEQNRATSQTVKPEKETSAELDSQSGADAKRDAAMRREEAAFHRLHPSLYKKHAGEYVAIHNEQLIDSDSDQVALYRRTRQQYPGEFVWITPINESPDEVLVFRSPRILNGQS